MLPDTRYRIHDTDGIYTPALLFYKEIIEDNIAQALKIARAPGRLRPHVKTHKTREIVRLELSAGITKHKCATLAEAEMLAQCAVPDVFLAYNMVGPNCGRLARLVLEYPHTRFAATADHPYALRQLSDLLAKEGVSVDVLLDVDIGMHRTGIRPGDAAVNLYHLIATLPGVRPGGIHAYDGHNHQAALAERRLAVQSQNEPLLALRARLEKEGYPVPRMVLGGTPTFSIYADLDIPGLECSPGTCILHDAGYGTRFQDLAGFVPAALVLTRVISRPASDRITLDLGYKAIASDPPAGKRCELLNVPAYEPIIQNEEHFAVSTPAAEAFRPGDVIYAMPTHVCPTCALHRQAYVIEDGRVTGRWEIVARDRVLTV